MRVQYRIGSTYRAPVRAPKPSGLVLGALAVAAHLPPVQRRAAPVAAVAVVTSATPTASAVLVVSALRPPRRAPRAWPMASVGTAALLAAAGCATGSPDFSRWKVEPIVSVSDPGSSSAAYYMVGRRHDAAGAWTLAIDAYRRAAIVDTRNVEAFNALGVALARNGEVTAAEATLRQAVVLAPERSHLRNNLGYVLLLAGRADEAVSALQVAVSLDPKNASAVANLRQATDQQAAAARTATPVAAGQASGHALARTVPQAMAMPTLVELPLPIASVHLPLPTAGVLLPLSTITAQLPMPRLIEVIDRPTIGSLEAAPVVGSAPARPSVLPAAVAEASAALLIEQAPAAEPALRLEVSNGNGVNGLAARIARWLAGNGLDGARLTNQRPYQQQLTTIQYRSGHEASAQRVARALRAADRAVSAAPTPSLRSDVRVLLGRDWSQHMACAGDSACAPVVALAGARRD
jgi:Flp pilus assembly protein TadD